MKKMFVMVVVALSLVALNAPAQAADGKWMMRARVINIAPSADADAALKNNLEVNNIDVDSQTTFEVDFTRFFTKHLALELSLATASHEVKVQVPEDLSIGSADLLPPSVVLQWHFMPEGKVKPYVGLGFNYTSFYNVTGLLSKDYLDADLGDSFGYAAQVGLDWKVGQKVYLNLDIKKIGMATDIKSGGTNYGTLTIDPLVIGIGMGFSF